MHTNEYSMDMRTIMRHILAESAHRFGIDYYKTSIGLRHEGPASNFKSALQIATRLLSRPGFTDGLEYLGVNPLGENPQFAILYCTNSYLQRIKSPEPAWWKVASEVILDIDRNDGRPTSPKIGKLE